MRNVILFSLIALGLSACISNEPQRVRWDEITSSQQVAKVQGIKSLSSPGFY